jgi:5-methylthioribose kinase
LPTSWPFEAAERRVPFTHTLDVTRWAPSEPDELDIERAPDLLRYLRGRGALAPDEAPSISVLGGGVSNRVVMVTRAGGESWVLKQALPKLRVREDWFSDPGRVRKEALGIRWLARLTPPGSIPRLVFEDPERHLLAMEAVRGPHRNWRTELLAGRLRPDHVEAFGRLLGQIHGGSRAHREDVAAVFDDRSIFESLRIEPYFAFTVGRVPEAAPFLERVIDDTRRHRLTLVHGDYSPKNVLVDDGHLVLLDHEVVHFGDPAFDVGFALTHLLSKAHHLAHLREAFGEAAVRFWGSYSIALGSGPWRAGLERRSARLGLACLLARVAGRSPLDYLTDVERRRQRAVSVELMGRDLADVPSLVARFLEGVSRA